MQQDLQGKHNAKRHPPLTPPFKVARQEEHPLLLSCTARPTCTCMHSDPSTCLLPHTWLGSDRVPLPRSLDGGEY